VARPRRSSPRIRSVVPSHGPRAGSPVARVEAGTSIEVVGSGFGGDFRRVTALFDGDPVPVFAVPFSETRLVVTTPLRASRSSNLQLQVGERLSNSVPLSVTRPRRARGAPGEATTAFIQTFDQFAALTASLARAVASGLGDATGILGLTAEAIDDHRKLLQRYLELSRRWGPVQERAPQPFEPVRTLELLDEAVATGRFTERVGAYTQLVYGPGGLVETGVERRLSDGSQSFEEALGETLADTRAEPPTWLGMTGSTVHEVTKGLEAFEDILDTLVPSFEFEVGASLIAQGLAGVDVHIELGHPLSALAKLIDIVAQWLEKKEEEQTNESLRTRIEQIERKLDRQEAKVDSQSQTLDGIRTTVDRISSTVTRIEQDVAQLEGKSDQQEQKSDRQQAAIDRIEFATKVLEGKTDLLHSEMHVLDGRVRGIRIAVDAIESKSDQLESKADAQRHLLEDVVKAEKAIEAKLDKLEVKADTAEAKADRALVWLDTLHDHLDLVLLREEQLEQKADSLETKADGIETKADAAETKLDILTGGVARLEGKADRAERKLDQLERKADQLERKHDHLESKVDRSPRLLPHEASVADQRGTGSHSSAAVTAVASGGDVYLRVAVDATRAQLRTPARWSAWTSFAAPPGGAPESISVDLQYEEGSDVKIDGVLSARNRAGDVSHRIFQGADHSQLGDPAAWSPWLLFLGQP
jgi:hypothetical protein